MKASNPYQPWRATEFPRLQREIVGVTWSAERLRIQVAEDSFAPPTVLLSFAFVHAYQGIDEGSRLLDSPDWSGVRALIYSSRSSPYLAQVRANAAGMLDNIDVVHWFVASCNECVDVISADEPTIELVR